MGKKFKRNNPSKLLAKIRAIKTKTATKADKVVKTDEQLLSPVDRIIWTYRINKKSKVSEITCVSYVTTIDGEDYTVIYYDNTHDGIMHSHLRNSVQDSSDAPIPLKVSKKGNQGKLMHWAIKDIMNNWYYYRRKFYNRSKLNSDF